MVGKDRGSRELLKPYPQHHSEQGTPGCGCPIPCPGAEQTTHHRTVLEAGRRQSQCGQRPLHWDLNPEHSRPQSEAWARAKKATPRKGVTLETAHHKLLQAALGSLGFPAALRVLKDRPGCLCYLRAPPRRPLPRWVSLPPSLHLAPGHHCGNGALNALHFK